MAVLAMSAISACTCCAYHLSASGVNPAGIHDYGRRLQNGGSARINLNVTGSFGTGRREINWDGVPDALSAPNGLPGELLQREFTARRDFRHLGDRVSKSARMGSSACQIRQHQRDVFRQSFQTFSRTATFHRHWKRHSRRELFPCRGPSRPRSPPRLAPSSPMWTSRTSPASSFST